MRKPSVRQGYRRRHVIGGAALLGGFAPSIVRAAVGGIVTDAGQTLAQPWDYIVVGGGSAGCVLARRLSENPAIKILLLEAGGAVADPQVSFPPAWPGLASGPYDWKYRSVPQTGLGGRTVAEPRGKGLGGSTLINAMGFQRGAHEAYDAWGETTGDPGWSFAGLLPYFRRLEQASAGADAYRGGDGPLPVLAIGGVADRNPLAMAIAAAGVAAGYPLNPDWNGARADGTIWSQLTVHDHRRVTAASAFLDPVRVRPNLGIVTGARVMRLRIEHGRCLGVAVAVDGRSHFVAAHRETIVSAGAFDSPRLLLLSGVGDPAGLKQAGIDVVHPLQGVGRNLHDHPLAPGLLFRARRPLPASNYNHCESMVVAASRHAPGWADLMLMGLSVPFLSPELGAPPPNSFAIVPALTFPRSRGTITVTGSDPDAPAAIDPAYLHDERDAEALAEGVDIARHLAATPPLQDWIAEELFPGPAVSTRSELAAYVRRIASPFYHPVGTCKMGRADDADAVVDPACRVIGLTGLRVVDASIFPSIPQAMTNAAVLAVAERASDLIRGEGSSGAMSRADRKTGLF